MLVQILSKKRECKRFFYDVLVFVHMLFCNMEKEGFRCRKIVIIQKEQLLEFAGIRDIIIDIVYELFVF